MTVSVSLAEHMPEVQETEGFVFVTPAGGAMVATLTTCVWAMANVGTNAAHSKTTSRAAINCTDHLLLFDRNVLARTPSALKNSTSTSLGPTAPNHLHDALKV